MVRKLKDNEDVQVLTDEQIAELSGDTKLDPKLLRQKVSRGEFMQVIKTMVENVNHITEYVTEDMNNLHNTYIYPLNLTVNALVRLFIAKGIITQEELLAEEKAIHQERIDKAKEVQLTKDNEIVLKETNTETSKEDISSV